MSNELLVNRKVALVRDTTANWNAKADYIPPKGLMCVYTDYAIADNGKFIPNIKIGDGFAYLIDLPFMNSGIESKVNEHILNDMIHTNLVEKTLWNSKITARASGETLMLI